MDLKVKARGSDDNRFLQVEAPDEVKGAVIKWVEVNPVDGIVLREILPRRFVEHDDAGKILCAHNVEYSELLETGGPEGFLKGKKWVEIKDQVFMAMDLNDIVGKYRVADGKLEAVLAK